MPATITYGQFKSYVAAQRGCAVADLSPSELTQLAAWTSAAYAYTFGDGGWPEAWTVVADKTVTNGLLADIGADDIFKIEVYTADPRPYDSTAEQVTVRGLDADGIFLDTDSATVWVRYIPRPADFTTASDATTMLWLLRDVTAWKALSYWFHAQQEHTQANIFSARAEKELDRLYNLYAHS